MNAYELKIEKGLVRKFYAGGVFVAAQVIPVVMVLLHIPTIFFLAIALLTTVGGAVVVIAILRESDWGKEDLELEAKTALRKLVESQQANTALQGRVADSQGQLSQNRVDLASQAAAVASSQVAQFERKYAEDLVAARQSIMFDANRATQELKATHEGQVSNLKGLNEELRGTLERQRLAIVTASEKATKDAVQIEDLQTQIAKSKQVFNQMIAQLREEQKTALDKAGKEAVAAYVAVNVQKAKAAALAKKNKPVAATPASDSTVEQPAQPAPAAKTATVTKVVKKETPSIKK